MKADAADVDADAGNTANAPKSSAEKTDASEDGASEEISAQRGFPMGPQHDIYNSSGGGVM